MDLRTNSWPQGAAFAIAVSLVLATAAFGQQPTVDYGREFRWFESAANQGDREALYRLGLFHERGIKTDPDPAMARHWYARAADLGHVLAQFRLASLLWEGVGGPADSEGAARWFRAAAGQGMALAQFNLAVILDQGLASEADAVEAAYFYESAARGGLPEAGVNLAMLHLDGRGVESDIVRAYAWLLVTDGMGYDGAKPALRDLQPDMNADQLGKAKDLAQILSQGIRPAPEIENQ